MQATLCMAAWVLSSNISPAACFAGTQTFAAPPVTLEQQRHRSSFLKFRNSHIEGVATFVDPPFHPSIENNAYAPATSQQQPQQQPSRSSSQQQLPTWLKIPRGHLAEANLESLREAMRASFFTENESLRLLYAIEEAAQGDRNKIAGAAEFCLLLVETMEMGLNALTAAVFHYCSCVTAREQLDPTLVLPTDDSAAASFGPHVVQITQDAARLKHLEMVAAAVMASQPGSGARVSPDEKDADNLKKLLLSETKDWRALALRSAACLYRLRGLLAFEEAPPRLTAERAGVAREALRIYAPLASRLGMHRLKNELEGAAFRILYRRQYDAVTRLADEQRHAAPSAAVVGQSMRRVLERVKYEMQSMLENDEEFCMLVERAQVTARVKEPYSMWKKMLRNNYRHILQVPDALALRIVLDAKRLSEDEPPEVTRARERALCYYTQKLCTENWAPLFGNPRFKDYIDRPKANGYQSLHYTAMTQDDEEGLDWMMEIQVRSGEMHQVAEFGLASHWDYKESSASSKSEEGEAAAAAPSGNTDHSTDAYLRKVQQWHWQQHYGARSNDALEARDSDASPASFEPVVREDVWQSKIRADRIRARTQRLQPYIEALTTAQSDLAREYVFVFLKRSDKTYDGSHNMPMYAPPSSTSSPSSPGKVLALPAGACVLDALRAGEKLGMGYEFSNEFDVNGVAASVTRRLVNGDVLTVPAVVATPTPL